MIRKADITKNTDGTWTIRVGRNVEHIDTIGKSKTEIYEAIRWALISKEVWLSEIELTAIIYDSHAS